MSNQRKDPPVASPSATTAPLKKAKDSSKEKSGSAGVFCVDVSGSVGGQTFYWERVHRLMERFLGQHPNGRFVLWDTAWQPVNKETLLKWIKERRGRGGTEPVHIVKSLGVLNAHENIWVITDGQVDQSSVDRAEEEIQRLGPLDHVECHIIDTSRGGGGGWGFGHAAYGRGVRGMPVPVITASKGARPRHRRTRIRGGAIKAAQGRSAASIPSPLPLLIPAPASPAPSAEADSKMDEAAVDNFDYTNILVGAAGAGVSIGNSVNLSVSCPFTRGNTAIVVYHAESLPRPYVHLRQSTEDYKILDAVDTLTLDTFLQRYEEIERLVVTLNMGRDGNLPLRDKLVELRRKLVREAARGFTDIGVQVKEILRSSAADASAQALARLHDMCERYYAKDVTKSLEEKMDHLIDLCGSLRGVFTMGDIQSNRARKAALVPNVSVQGVVSLNPDSSNPDGSQAQGASAAGEAEQSAGESSKKLLLECPILMDKDTPVIMINQGTPVLADIDKKIVDSIVNCPLNLLHHPNLIERLKNRLGQWIGLEALKSSGIVRNPFTQGEIAATLSLGCHPTHIALSNHALAAIFTEGRLLGQLDLYMAVIYLVVQKGTVPYLSETVEAIGANVAYRIDRGVTFTSLSGLSQYVCATVPTEVALWFVSHSPKLRFKPDQDPSRLHASVIPYIFDLLKLMNLPIDPEVEVHNKRLQALLYLLKKFKKERDPRDEPFEPVIVDPSTATLRKRPRRGEPVFRGRGRGRGRGRRHGPSRGGRSAASGGDADADADADAGAEERKEKTGPVVPPINKANQNRTRKLIKTILYQGHVLPSTGEVILLDSPSDLSLISQLPSFCSELPPNELYALAELANPQISEEDLPFPFEWSAPPLPKTEKHWPYPADPGQFAFPELLICPNTFRPLSRVQPTQGFSASPVSWKVAAENALYAAEEFPSYSHNAKLWSAHRYYVECWIKLGRPPTADDFLSFAAARSHFRGIPTLPSIAVQAAESLVRQFAPLAELDLQVEEVARRFRSSAPVQPRQAEEESRDA